MKNHDSITLGKRKLNSIIGFTDCETVKLDFDSTSFKTVKYWACRACRWFRLGGFIILKSSNDGYHVIFNRVVSWSENMRIVAWVSLLSHIAKTEKWFVMQCIKEGSTVRVSRKRDKPSPRIVFRHGKQDGQIKSFLRFRRLIKRIIRKLEVENQLLGLP